MHKQVKKSLIQTQRANRKGTGRAHLLPPAPAHGRGARPPPPGPPPARLQEPGSGGPPARGWRCGRPPARPPPGSTGPGRAPPNPPGRWARGGGEPQRRGRGPAGAERGGGAGPGARVLSWGPGPRLYQMPLDRPPGGARIRAEARFGTWSSICEPAGRTHGRASGPPDTRQGPTATPAPPSATPGPPAPCAHPLCRGSQAAPQPASSPPCLLQRQGWGAATAAPPCLGDAHGPPRSTASTEHGWHGERDVTPGSGETLPPSCPLPTAMGTAPAPRVSPPRSHGRMAHGEVVGTGKGSGLGSAPYSAWELCAGEMGCLGGSCAPEKGTHRDGGGDTGMVVVGTLGRWWGRHWDVWGCPVVPGSPCGRWAGGLDAAPLLPDRLKLDSCRSLMPPCRVAGRVGVSARGVPVSFFPACTTTATSPRYGVRSTALSFKLCRKGSKKQREP